MGGEDSGLGRLSNGSDMRRMIVVLVLVVSLAAAYRSYGSPTTGTGTLTLPPPAPTPGEDAPNFTANGLGGETFALSKRGTYVLVFWDNLGYYSNQSKPYFRQLAEDFADEEVRFGAVYVDKPWEKDPRALPYAVMWDRNGRLASLYNVKRVPRLFVIKDGTVRMVYDDFSPEGYGEVRKTLEQLAPSSS
jgi:peroxiredoxin